MGRWALRGLCTSVFASIIVIDIVIDFLGLSVRYDNYRYRLSFSKLFRPYRTETFLVSISNPTGYGPLVYLTLDVVCWVCHNNQNMEWSLTRGLFDPERGISLRNVTKRGTLRKKGDFSKLCRWKGYPREGMTKRGICSHPPFDRSRSPAKHMKKQKKTL